MKKQRIVIDEIVRLSNFETGKNAPKLPKPLSELDELVRMLTPFRRKRTRDEIVAEAQRMLNEKQEFLRKREMQESWRAAGLSPEAAEVAARVELKKRPADLPPVTEWANLLSEAFGGRR